VSLRAALQMPLSGVFENIFAEIHCRLKKWLYLCSINLKDLKNFVQAASAGLYYEVFFIFVFLSYSRCIEYVCRLILFPMLILR